MVKKIVFPKINNFTSEEVKQKFLEILKSIKLNIKYVRLVNIRESLTGLRFYIKTKNFFAIGEYDCILTNLFHQINENIKAEAKEAEKEKKAYQKIINTIKEATEAITTPDEAMEVLDLINNQKHVLTSEKESKSILFDKTKELGFKWNKLKGEFVNEVSDDTKSA